MLAPRMPGKQKTPSTKRPASAAPVPSAEAKALEFAIEAAGMLGDDKCQDVVVMDVRTLSQVTDFIVVASGTSDRQMHGSLKNVEDLGVARGNRLFRSSTDDRASWLLADFVDVIVHVFEPNARAHYDLEMLWGDAPRIEWQRSDKPARPGRRSG